MKKYGKSRSLSENIFLNREDLLLFFARSLYPLKFDNNKDHLIALKEITQAWYELLNLFDQLKLYEISSIIRILEEKDLVSQIFSVKEAKLKSIVQEYKQRKISTKEIESLMDKWIQSEPPVISPLVLTSINTTFFVKYHLVLLLKNSSDIMPVLQNLKSYCTRLLATVHKEYIMVQFYLPNLSSSEKAYFVFILKNLFKDNLLFLQRYFFSGYMKIVPIKDFYDVERQGFFYTKDLFHQYFLYVQKVCGPPLPVFEEDTSRNPLLNQESFDQKDMNTLVQMVENRLFKQSLSFQRKDLQELERFHHHLSAILVDRERYNSETQQAYLSSYVKAIHFIPNLPRYGLSQYFLYIRPRTLQEFDFKALLGNTFTKVKQSLNIESVPTLWIESIFPYHNPNTAYLNWAAYSGKLISEYCLFTLKTVHVIFHSNYNFSSQGWDYDSKRFKAYAQKIISDPNFSPPNYVFKKYNVDSYEPENILGPDNAFFQTLVQLFGYKPSDLKLLFTLKSTSPQKILPLIEKQVIYPYFTLKNAGFQEKITLLIPSVKKVDLDSIIKIFSFFNYGFISEIEGELFLYGYPKPVEFENGLMIQLYMPHCELSEFQADFAELFHHFKIDKYVFLHDLVKANDLLVSVFGSLEFLNRYNPLLNLNWDPDTKVWQNPKLFGKKFEKKYPSLGPP